MSDHADVIREWLSLDPRADWEATPDDFAEAVAALDALVAERDAALGIETEVILDDLRAAEAEVARLQIALSLHPNTQAFLKQTELREAAEARVTELEAALTQILYASENNQGMSIIARFDAIHAAALAALAKEDTDE